jgi:hypothetical protein
MVSGEGQKSLLRHYQLAAGNYALILPFFLHGFGRRATKPATSFPTGTLVFAHVLGQLCLGLTQL